MIHSRVTAMHLHGCTVATNANLEHNFADHHARFRDVLERAACVPLGALVE